MFTYGHKLSSTANNGIELFELASRCIFVYKKVTFIYGYKLINVK